MKKIISITLAVTTILWLVGTGLFAFIPVAKAAVVDGDVVSSDAAFVDADGNTYQAYDVFIVKIVGTKTFKRLVLNPQVFDSYGHLKWSNIKKIAAATVAGYTTSSLVREINDTKVYKLVPDGDTGTKQWVDDLACFTSKAYDWDSVYIINATDRDNYTTGSSLCGVVTPTGALTLSLASDTPAASTVPPNAQGITFLKVNVSGSGTVNQVTITRGGAGAVGDFGDLYIYKDEVRLTSGRSLSSSNSKVTFINLGIAAPATFDVVVDMSTGTAGDINYFSIETASEVTGDATIGGTFPIKGNPMGISGTNAGTITLTRSGASARNVTIGATEQEISQFKLTTATEGAYVKKVRLFNGGTADNNLITNLKLKNTAGTTIATATSISSGGYADFVLSPSFFISKGDNEIFRVYADIGGTKPDRTIILYAEIATDILATGNVYGYGMAATITGFDTTGEAVTITCKGGDLTLNDLGPNAANIGDTTSDTVFLEYSMTAAADITIKRTRLVFCLDAGGEGTYEDDWVTASTSAGADIEDIKIRDKDAGVIVIGPKDGTSFNDAEYNNGCPGAKDGIYEDFTDTIDMSAGETKTYQVTGDIKVANTNSGAVISATDKLRFYLYSYASLVGTSGNVNYMKYAGTSDAVDDSAIAPSGDIAGEEMTIAAPSLALTLGASPSGGDATNDEKVYIAGQPGVEAVGIVFTAGSASDITINSIQLTGYTVEQTGGAFAAGIDTNYVKDTIAKVYIYDKSTGELVTGSSAKGFTSGTNFEQVDFTGLSWVIPSGSQKTLLVKVDISSAAPASASTADTWISFDIATAADDVTAIDKDGNSVTTTGDAPNGAAGTDVTVNFGVADYGTLTIDQATDTPDKSIAVMGTTDNEVSKFKLTGANEGWYLETFSIVLEDGGSAIDPEDRDNFSAVKVKYQTESQYGTSNWTISSGKTFGSTASLAFTFSGSDRVYVPKDNDAYITVLASIAGYNGGMGAKSKVPFKLYDIDGSDSSLKAYGAQSGKLLTEYSTDSAATTDFNLHFVARSKPVFAKSAWSGGELELARFTITAVGYDVIFAGKDNDNTVAGSIASACLRFDTVASTQVDAAIKFYLYDWNENILSSASVTQTDSTAFDGTVTSISFQFEVLDATVPSGTTKEFHVDMSAGDLVDILKTDEYIYLQLRNDDGGSLATGSMDTGGRDIVWSDGTNEEGISTAGTYANSGDPELRFGMPALIKNVGPLPITFRSLRGTGTP